jgi:molybdopterin-guanine dinucleotide biosynthesis protein A
MKIHGFVTAGGRSSRMGRDKAWLELGGRSMIELVIEQLRSITTEIGIIASGKEYERLGCSLFSDEKTSIGPLEAIRTALTNARASLIVLVACDLPFVKSELFAELIRRTSNYDAVVPVGPDGRLEPLCAVYSTRALKAATELIEGGERKVNLLFDRVPTSFVAFEELQKLEGSDSFFTNVNTPEDYTRAQEILLKALSGDCNQGVDGS